jgi:hypothetical protein
LEVPLGEDETMLRFLPGWVNKETHRLEDGWMAPGGVWTMSQRARERIEKGDRPFRRSSPRRSLGKTAYGYPALVICPACHQAQVADEGVLGLR